MYLSTFILFLFGNIFSSLICCVAVIDGKYWKYNLLREFMFSAILLKYVPWYLGEVLLCIINFTLII